MSDLGWLLQDFDEFLAQNWTANSKLLLQIYKKHNKQSTNINLKMWKSCKNVLTAAKETDQIFLEDFHMTSVITNTSGHSAS